MTKLTIGFAGALILYEIGARTGVNAQLASQSQTLLQIGWINGIREWAQRTRYMAFSIVMGVNLAVTCYPVALTVWDNRKNRKKVQLVDSRIRASMAVDIRTKNRVLTLIHRTGKDEQSYLIQQARKHLMTYVFTTPRDQEIDAFLVYVFKNKFLSDQLALIGSATTSELKTIDVIDDIHHLAKLPHLSAIAAALHAADAAIIAYRKDVPL